MPARFSSSGPDLKGSESGLQRRKASLTEQYPRASVGGFKENDLLADTLFVPQALHVGNHADSPIDNVRNVLEKDDASDPSPLFCEMMYLSTETDEDEEEAAGPQLFWHQVARWIKYEQDVEGDGTRFSKPHITLLSLHALLQIKNCVRKGVVLLDAEASSFVQLCSVIISSWVENGFLDEDQVNLVKDILYAPKLHLIQGKMRRINEMVSRETFKARRDSHVSMLESIKSDPISREPSEQNSTKYEDADERLLKKLAPDTESAVILVANVDALERPLTALVRLKHPQLLYPEIPDHPVPARFVFVLLNPHDNYYNETTGLGRALGALFSDEIFQKVAYNSMDKHTIADGIEEFLTQIVAIPPGKCTTDTRWEPKEEGVEIRHAGMLYADYDGDPFADEFDEKQLKAVASGHAPSIVRTGRCFGGLVEDVKTKAPWFASDFIDFFRGRLSQSIAATILIFFGNITNIITFGAVMERALHHQMAAIENILCGGLSGVIFGIFSGQPLNILSATGPTLVFEKILYDFCTANHWEFLPFRFWVGIWVAFFLMVLVATDSSALVGLITRFTEEAFATLISTVFIIQAFQKLYEISHDAPITRRPEEVLHSSCHCIIETPNGPNNTLIKNLSMGVTRCRELGGVPQGMQCFFKPDVYMFSVLLTFGTFFIAYKLNSFRRSPYLTSKMRNAISDFGVLIAIILMTLLTNAIGLEIPSLNVPSSLRPTLDRHWIVDIWNIESAYIAVLAALPAAFYTILIVMDQQITAVIVNRKDNRLKKGAGYHLDLLVIVGLVVACSFLGLPFYVAATVLSVMHVDALKLQSEVAAPGEKPRFLGIKEQRLTTIIAHIMIGASVFLTPLVKLVPLPVLTGIFLYMGVVSLLGQQFVQRITLLFMPIKHQPDYSWLRTVRMKRVHLFTVIQILSILGLFAIKYASTISMMFPVMLVVMVIIRMYILERLFTKKELLALDDDLPTFREVMQPKKKARRTNGLVLDDEEKQQLKGTAKKRNNESVASKGQA